MSDPSLTAENSSRTAESLFKPETPWDEFKKVSTISTFSKLGCSANLLKYLNIANNNCYLGNDLVLSTQDLVNVASQLDSNPRVALTGPKGCGKTFIGTVLSIILQKKPTLYLAQGSFTNTSCKKYFLEFLELYKSCIKSYEFYDMFRKYEVGVKCLANNVIELIEHVTKVSELFLFIDFGNICFYENDFDTLDALMDCASICIEGKLTTLISTSSGISVVESNPKLSKKLAARLDAIVSRSCKEILITGFTDQEADLFIKQIGNKNLTTRQVKQVSGTNPLLLSRLKKQDDFNKYSARVECKINVFLERNLLIKRETGSVEGFLTMQDWECCEKFIYYACRGDQMSDVEHSEYHRTWMYSNNVAIVFDECRLKFNFPSLGLHLIKIFKNYAAEKVITLSELSEKHQSVAGFSFEVAFSKHCRSTNSLQISYTNISGNSVSHMELIIDLVTDFNYKKLSVGCLYELKVMHAVIDFVGHLKSHDGTKYLVFVQLSLQTYKAHKKLSDIFKASPSKNSLPDDLQQYSQHSLFRFYSNLIEDEQGADKILFLYISPEEESTSLMTQLKADLSPVVTELQADMYVGAISRESSFYSNMLVYKIK